MDSYPLHGQSMGGAAIFYSAGLQQVSEKGKRLSQSPNNQAKQTKQQHLFFINHTSVYLIIGNMNKMLIVRVELCSDWTVEIKQLILWI